MNKISIQIPIYNAATYLIACCNSIMQQTDVNWEAILVDDYSTDNTFVMLQKITKQDPRFIIVKNENQKGIIGALQTAYKYSTGNIITRMDADDLMKTNKLKQMREILEVNGSGILAVGKVKYFAENGVGDGYQKYENWLNKLTSSNNNFSELYKECPIPSPAWMSWKEDFEKCGAYNSNIYPEDYDLAFRFYKNGLRCVGTHEVVHLWRDYQNRTSRTDENYADNRFFDIKLKYFLELDYNKEQELTIWGAGKKGKMLAQKLVSKNINFKWVCNNENKIGKDIYGVKLETLKMITKDAQIIIAVAGEIQQRQIQDFLVAKNISSASLFYFC